MSADVADDDLTRPLTVADEDSIYALLSFATRAGAWPPGQIVIAGTMVDFLHRRRVEREQKEAAEKQMEAVAARRAKPDAKAGGKLVKATPVKAAPATRPPRPEPASVTEVTTDLDLLG